MKPLVKKDLTEKQNTFLETLLGNGGNVVEAMDVAGYHPSSRSRLMKSVKDEIIEQTKYHLASSSVKAANRLIEGLDADGTLSSSQMDTRLKAANDILDRTGVSKRHEVSSESKVIHGVVLLPSKKPMVNIPT